MRLLISSAAFFLLAVLCSAGGKKEALVSPKPARQSKQASYKVLVLRPAPPRREFIELLQVAMDCIHDADWKNAVTALQLLLNMDADYFYYVKEGKRSRWTSFRWEANRLLAAMPPAGKKAYEAAFGAQAAKALTAAKKTGKGSPLAHVAGRFAHTRAGEEVRLWLSGFSATGFQIALPNPQLLGALAVAPVKGDEWPKPQPEHAYVKYLPDSQLWLKTDGDVKKHRARFDPRPAYVVDCALQDIVSDGPVLRALAKAVVIVDTPR